MSRPPLGPSLPDSPRRLVVLAATSLALALALLMLLPTFTGSALASIEEEVSLSPTFLDGGPDQFGYTFKDSNQPGGPSYQWEEISGTGIVVGGWSSSDDGYAGPIPIGFDFDFYGQRYNQLFLGTNGYLNFGQPDWTIPGSGIPNPTSPNNDIALFGGDMFLNNYGVDTKVHYQSFTNPTRLVVEYTNLYNCCSANTARTFQAILYQDGDVQTQYRTLNGTTSTYVGIENATGTDGLAYGASLADSLAIRYYHPKGPSLDPPTQMGYGQAGQMVTYTLQLTNQSDLTDRYDVAVEANHAWPTTLSITRTGLLAPGQSVAFDAFVAVPQSAAAGDQDRAVIRASSVISPTDLTDTAALTTTVTSGELGYVTLTNGNKLALVDTITHAVVSAIDLAPAGCNGPWQVAMTPGGDAVYVSCYYSGNVVVVDQSSSRILSTVPTSYGSAGIAFTVDGNFAIVANSSFSSLFLIDTQTFAVSTMSVPSPVAGIAVHPVLQLAYAITSSGSLLVIDTEHLAIVATLDLGYPGYAVAVSHNGRWVFATHSYSGQLAVIDAWNNSLYTSVASLDAVNGVAVAPDGSAVYVASGYAGVRVIDGASFQLVTTVPASGAPNYLAVTCDGAELWVGNLQNEVPVINTSTNQVAMTIPMPVYSSTGLAICPQYVAQDVFIVPPEQTNAGARGETVTHQISILNATGDEESFNLSLGSSAWPASLSATTVGPLAQGERATVTVSVEVPADVAWYTIDTVQVTASAIGHPAFDATARLNTKAYAPSTISVSPLHLASTQAANTTVTRTLTINNSNGVTLTVALDDYEVTPSLVTAAPLHLPRAADVFTQTTGVRGDTRSFMQSPRANRPVPRVLAANQEPSLEIQAGGYYTTTSDNQNNALTGTPDGDMDRYICEGEPALPVEFDIIVDRLPGLTGAVLTIRAYDVYSPEEVDEVRLNGVVLGDLVGSSNAWSETSFDVPAGVVVRGPNLVQVFVSITGGGWCAEIDWGELFVAASPAPWLREDPQAAAILSNESQTVTVTFDSTGVQPGEYVGGIGINSNDPAHPLVQIPVTMTVEATADMGRVTGAISDVWTGQPLTATVELMGVYTATARPVYEIWAPAGSYSLIVSASGYVTATLPVTITAGGSTVQNVSLEPARPKLEWSPEQIDAHAFTGGSAARTLMLSNAGPVPLDFELFEIDVLASQRAPSAEDLSGKHILFDRAHNEPASSEYGTLVADAIAAGADVDENWYFPIEDQVLKNYDILWVNCCGGVSWGFSELIAVNNWLRQGGAVFVQGQNSSSTAGLASIFGIYYIAATCTSGTTTDIRPHPISAGVSSISVPYTCWRLSPSVGSDLVVFDPVGQPHVVAKQANGGKMVVVGSEDFQESNVGYANNRLLANNILQWLARPAYGDVPWMTVSPISGTIPAHTSWPVAVEFDAANLALGNHHAILAIEHNDPAQTFPAEVPVNLTVLPVESRLKYLPLMLVR